MARADGYVCDRKACSKFEYAAKTTTGPTMPSGWITVTVAGNGNGGGGVLQVCSARCHAEIAIERCELAEDRPFARKPRK